MTESGAIPDQIQPDQCRLFVCGPLDPGPLSFQERKTAAAMFKMFIDTTSVTGVVTTGAPGLDHFAMQYFKHRDIPVTLAPPFRGVQEQRYEILVRLDVQFGVFAPWAAPWLEEFDMLEIPYVVLWEKI